MVGVFGVVHKGKVKLVVFWYNQSPQIPSRQHFFMHEVHQRQRSFFKIGKIASIDLLNIFLFVGHHLFVGFPDIAFFHDQRGHQG